MADVYRIETYPEYEDNDGSFYNVTKNGEVLLTRVRHDQARAHVLTLIGDEDRYLKLWNGKVYCDSTGRIEKNPGNIYRVETRTGYRNERSEVLFDVTKNGQTILTGVLYLQARAHVLALLEDNDRYQEAENGKVRFDHSGMAEKQNR
jgi:hypothetical protein